MTIRVYFRNAAGDIEEITDALAVETLEVSENAEEGSVAISRVALDDPDMTLDIGGHRLFYIEEDEVYGEEPKIFRGFTADRSYSRGQHPLGREIQAQVADMNVVWQRRVMVGADCKRPAETDVARMQWLVTTAEAGLIDDDTYLSTASPVNMDKCDYRGQMMGSVADDCAQASGKNWYITHDDVTGLGPMIWYGHQALEVYDSPLRLSNVLSEIDDVTTFAISDDTTLQRDPSRVFSGVYLPYDGGAVYRQSADTATAFARRDVVMPSANVKSKTKAIARAVRYLADLDEETDRITTAVLLPAAQVNDIRPGMRVQFGASHLPGYEFDYHWVRVLSRTVAYWVPGQYKLTLVLDGPGTVDVVEPESCGIAYGDGFVCNFPPSNPNTRSSASTGPTLTLTPGKQYRVAVYINSVLRARPEAYTSIQASPNWAQGTASNNWDPDPAFWVNTYPVAGNTTYSDWFTYTGASQTGWLQVAVGTVWNPSSSMQATVYVECV
jgi:hypothetical protein